MTPRSGTSAFLRLSSRALAVAGTVGVLSACSAFNVLQDPIVLNCPEYRILADAAFITSFREGPGRDVTDIEYCGQMGAVEMSCLSEIDSDTNSGIMEVDIAPVIQMELGPAGDSSEEEIQYFIVVTDVDKNILYREELSMTVSFAENRTRFIVTAPITTLELQIEPDVRSNFYSVYSGFALTRDQVEYNRQNDQRRRR